MRQLHHPHLLRLHCCFLEGDTLWLVMPYVDAGNLAVIMQSCAPEVCDRKCTMYATTLKEKNATVAASGPH